eukprot:tig00000640_g2778.t1
MRAVVGSRAPLRAAPPATPRGTGSRVASAPRCEAPNDFAPDDAFGGRILDVPFLDDVVVSATDYVPSVWTPVEHPSRREQEPHPPAVPSSSAAVADAPNGDEERIPMPPELRPELVPRHVAIIMDGNGRWARQRGMPRIAGHERGVEALRNIVRACLSWGVEHLTVYAFSTENRSRKPAEVEFLMGLFSRALAREMDALDKNGVRVRFAGDLGALPAALQREAAAAERRTRGNGKLQLRIALNYGGRDEIAHAAREIARRARDGLLDPESITEETVAGYLFTSAGPGESRTPDPDLVIRSGGEHRLSNFLLWQAAYAELYVANTFWPDFGTREFGDALLWFQGRTRRFGLA